MTYEALLGELSTGMRAPWMAAAPDSVEVLGDTEIGTEKRRYEFAAPPNAPIHFLRLRIEP